jgi:hypothetical protein
MSVTGKMHESPSFTLGKTPCQILRPCLISFRRVDFLTDVKERPGNVPSLIPVQESGICQLVDGEDRVKLALSVHHDELMHEGILPRNMRERVMNYPSTSLGSILAKGGLTHKMRLLLSITLARAVWQFYDSDWMIQEWDKEQIHFVYTCKDGTPIGQLYASKPFFSMQANVREAQDSAKGRIHKFPKILSLGVMLLEIELDLTIESQRRQEHLRSNGEPNNNTNHTTAHLLFENDQLWADRETYDIHKAVIGECIMAERFESCTNSDEERDMLLERIVNPLQKLLKVAWPSLDEGSLGPMKLEPKTSNANHGLPQPYYGEITSPTIVQTHVNTFANHSEVMFEHGATVPSNTNGNTGDVLASVPGKDFLKIHRHSVSFMHENSAQMMTPSERYFDRA